MSKKAGIFNPYFDTEGGGERYCLGVMEAWQQLGYNVDIFWHDTALPVKLEDRFGIKMIDVGINTHAFAMATSRGNWQKKFMAERVYDRLMFVSDGSVPVMFGKKNVLHFQVPFRNVRGTSLGNRMKMMTIHKVVCNSQFTKRVIDEEFGLTSQVIYPPVSMMEPLEKQPLILSVGRFDSPLHNKRQDALIEAFKLLHKPAWKLVLAGGTMGETEYLRGLQRSSKGYPISIITNPSWTELKKMYGHASVYWHAAGFGADLRSNPEQAEHFGITTVEAMSAKAVPVVFAGGGLREIVSETCGRTWSTLEELVTETQRLIDSPSSRERLAQAAHVASEKFNQERFAHAVKNTIG